MWLNVNFKGYEFIIGSYYFPCNTSKYYKESIFEDLSTDILSIQAKTERPIYLLGDANAHSGKLRDILRIDDKVAHDFGLDLLSDMKDGFIFGPVVAPERANSDKSKTNVNGKHLISACQATDLLILNGRAGQDKGIGNYTCFKLEEDGTHTGVSTIDYCLANKCALENVYDFEVDMFDRMLSDRHSPICLTLRLAQHSPVCNNVGNIPDADSTREEPTTPKIKFMEWSHTIAESFKNSLETLNLDKLNEISAAHPSQDNIDTLCDELKKVTIDAAIKSKACKVETKNKNNSHNSQSKAKQSDYKPWFDKECTDEKKMYFKNKNFNKRQGKKVVANKLSKNFKKFLDSKKKSFNRDLNKRLKNLRSTCPRDYWNIINRCEEGKKVEAKVSMETFFEHFKELSVTKPENDHEVPTNTPSDANPFLNRVITIEEVIETIEFLKIGKASGPDGIRNEFLKHLPSDLVDFICSFFNKILDSGLIPKEWTLGMIMPLFKNKGSNTDPSNYRGITLLSCMGKLFTAILNRRIALFMNANNLLGMEQAGFRAGHSTMDHVFALHHIIDYYRQRGKQVYCAFVDYTKAFDLVNRSALWCKLLKQGINGKVLTVIQNMYSEAKSCVRVGGKLSDYFQCTAGVRQGENLSPILFAIYLNDFNAYLAESSKGLSNLEENLEELDIFVKLCVLLYADDTVILAETAADLQNSLDALCNYSKSWDLKVNLSKTQIVIFSKGRITTHPEFMYDGKVVDVVDDYTYLGVVFNYNGNFKKAILNQRTVATRALKSLLRKAKILDLDVDTQMELFQRCVMPILLYGCELWGFEKNNVNSLEIFYKRFIKTALNLFTFTPSCMIFGESGQPNLSDLIRQRLTNFWGKLKYDEVPRLSKHMLKYMLHLNGKTIPNSTTTFNFPWLNLVNTSLDELGMSYCWNPPIPLDHRHISYQVKAKTRDVREQLWLEEVNLNAQCSIYKQLMTAWGMPKYIQILKPSLRTTMCRFRTRCHNLPVTCNRFKTGDGTNTMCPLCTCSQVGDEYHYIFICNHFLTEREKYLPPEYLRTQTGQYNLKELFDEENEDVVVKLAKFCKLIMKKFSREKPLTPLKIRKTHVMASGRVSKRPGYLNDYFV